MGASRGEGFQQKGMPGTGASSGEGFQQQGLPGTEAPSNGDSPMHIVCPTTTSRTRTAGAREALVNHIGKNCKWEQLLGTEKMLKTDAYQQLRNMALKVNMLELRYGSDLDIRGST